MHQNKKYYKRFPSSRQGAGPQAYYGILKLSKYSLSAPAAYDKIISVCCEKQQFLHQRCDTVRNKMDISQLSPEELEAEKQRRRKKLRRKKAFPMKFYKGFTL